MCSESTRMLLDISKAKVPSGLYPYPVRFTPIVRMYKLAKNANSRRAGLDVKLRDLKQICLTLTRHVEALRLKIDYQTHQID